MLLLGLWGIGCGGGSKTINVPPGNTFQPTVYPGDWTGTWNNTTYGTTGSAKLTFTNDSGLSKLTIRHELGGNVLGSGAPAPETFEGTYTTSGITMTGTSTRFGAMTLTIASDGRLTGSGVGTSNPSITRVDYTGVITPTKIEINYTVTFLGGTVARGNAILNKAP